MDHSTEAVAQLIEELSASDPNQRAHAAIELGSRNAHEALPKLKHLSLDPNQLVALAAMYSCWQLGEEKIDIPILLDAASGEDESLTALAVEIVSSVGDPLVEKLVPYIADTNGNTRVVLDLLFEIGNEHARTAIQQLQTKDVDIKVYANQLLDNWDD